MTREAEGERVIDGPTGVAYVRTGERRVPKDGEDYLIAEGVVGTALRGIHRTREIILRREAKP